MLVIRLPNPMILHPHQMLDVKMMDLTPRGSLTLETIMVTSHSYLEF